MGGEIKVVKKNSPGTLMKLYLLLNTPTDATEPLHQQDFTQHGISVSTSSYIPSFNKHQPSLLVLKRLLWNA